MGRWIRKLFRNDSGASAAEYVILVSCIAITIISVLALFGSSVEGLYIKGDGIFNK